MDVWSPTCFRMAADRFKSLSSAVTPGFRIASPEEAGESPFPLDNYLPWRSRLVIGDACYQRLKTSRDQRERWIERVFQQLPRRTPRIDRTPSPPRLPHSSNPPCPRPVYKCRRSSKQNETQSPFSFPFRGGHSFRPNRPGVSRSGRRPYDEAPDRGTQLDSGSAVPSPCDLQK